LDVAPVSFLAVKPAPKKISGQNRKMLDKNVIKETKKAFIYRHAIFPARMAGATLNNRREN
jgi:hypothetical protein